MGTSLPERRLGFLLIYAQNTSKEENRKAILSDVQHEWPSGSKFTFNCYRHWSTILVRDLEDGSGHFLNSKEGVIQGDPLSMISYDIGVLPLIRELWDEHLCVAQSCYADDVGAGGTFKQILAHI